MWGGALGRCCVVSRISGIYRDQFQKHAWLAPETNKHDNLLCRHFATFPLPPGSHYCGEGGNRKLSPDVILRHARWVSRGKEHPDQAPCSIAWPACPLFCCDNAITRGCRRNESGLVAFRKNCGGHSLFFYFLFLFIFLFFYFRWW